MEAAAGVASRQSPAEGVEEEAEPVYQQCLALGAEEEAGLRLSGQAKGAAAAEEGGQKCP